VRNIRLIAPEELIEAIRMTSAADIESDDAAVRKVARLLGFRRIGSDIRDGILPALTEARQARSHQPAEDVPEGPAR
jgi:hypothetical protein